MKFMCGEMRNGLLKGKTYRDSAEGHTVRFNANGNLEYTSPHGDKDTLTGKPDLLNEWTEVQDYTLSFGRALIEMDENGKICCCEWQGERVRYAIRNRVLYHSISFGPYMEDEDARLNELTAYKWKVMG